MYADVLEQVSLRCIVRALHYACGATFSVVWADQCCTPAKVFFSLKYSSFSTSLCCSGLVSIVHSCEAVFIFFKCNYSLCYNAKCVCVCLATYSFPTWQSSWESFSVCLLCWLERRAVLCDAPCGLLKVCGCGGLIPLLVFSSAPEYHCA